MNELLHNVLDACSMLLCYLNILRFGKALVLAPLHFNPHRKKVAMPKSCVSNHNDFTTLYMEATYG